jgi:hypothetical protein
VLDFKLMTWRYPFRCEASSNRTESPALTSKEGKDERQWRYEEH